MKLPRDADARIERDKIVNYLLDTAHPDGGPKAEFFLSFGFTRARWRLLERAIRGQVQEHEVIRVVESVYGTRYIIDGEINAPDGRTPRIRTVWIIEADNAELGGPDAPRLITAHPI